MKQRNDTTLFRLIKNIKNLKESRIDVTPFTLQEVQKIIETVRDPL